jgi:hypothetical protein
MADILFVSLKMAMTKTELEQAYQELNAAYSELCTHVHDYKFGSNRKLREKAERQMEIVKLRVGSLLRNKYPEIYMMAAGGESAGDYGRAITMDEFFQNRYIVGDLGDLLRIIKEEIDSL